MEVIKCYIDHGKVHLEIYQNDVYVKHIIADSLYNALSIKDFLEDRLKDVEL